MGGRVQILDGAEKLLPFIKGGLRKTLRGPARAAKIIAQRKPVETKKAAARIELETIGVTTAVLAFDLAAIVLDAVGSKDNILTV
jgi:hypothetical protein